ncbi:MAG TPA: hypothetical protein PKD12_22620 [Nitrospira sp.]|nr:hypothetical protein [Nitrospira sp.]
MVHVMDIQGYPVRYTSARRRQVSSIGGLLCLLAVATLPVDAPVEAQSASGVRSFAGGVAPLLRLPGGNLYIDNQGTQGMIYVPGPNVETYNFRNPTTGQAWSGAAMTFGPQLSIGLIQGSNQTGSPTVLPPPPRQTDVLPPIESGLFEPFP